MGWRHLPCLQKEPQGPLAGKVAMLNQKTLQPQRSWQGTEALWTQGAGTPAPLHTLGAYSLQQEAGTVCLIPICSP